MPRERVYAVVSPAVVVAAVLYTLVTIPDVWLIGFGAMFFAMLADPARRRLAGVLPDGAAAGLSVFLPATLCVVGIGLLGAYLPDIAGEDAAVERSLREATAQLQQWSRRLPLPTLGGKDAAAGLAAALQGAMATLAQSALGLFLALSLAAIVLAEKAQWRHAIEEVVGECERDRWETLLCEVSGEVRQYVFWKTVTGLGSALLSALVMWVGGVPMVPLWATLVWVLSYIPNVGAVVSTFFPTVLAFSAGGPWAGFGVFAGLVAIEQLTGTFIGPVVQGQKLQITASAVLAALVVFGAILGPVGALMAPPLVLVLRAVGRHYDWGLRPAGELITEASAGQAG